MNPTTQKLLFPIVAAACGCLIQPVGALGPKDAWDALDRNLAPYNLKAFRPAETGWYPGGVVAKGKFGLGSVVDLVTPPDRFWVEGFDYLTIYTKSQAELANADVLKGLELEGKVGLDLHQIPVNLELVHKRTTSYTTNYRGETIWRLPEQTLIEYRDKIRRGALGPFLSPGPKFIPLKILLATGVDVTFEGNKEGGVELTSDNILEALGVNEASASAGAKFKYSGKTGSKLSFDVADPKNALAIGYGMFLPLSEKNKKLLLDRPFPPEPGTRGGSRSVPAKPGKTAPRTFPDPVVATMEARN